MRNFLFSESSISAQVRQGGRERKEASECLLLQDFKFRSVLMSAFRRKRTLTSYRTSMRSTFGSSRYQSRLRPSAGSGKWSIRGSLKGGEEVGESIPQTRDTLLIFLTHCVPSWSLLRDHRFIDVLRFS